MLNKRVLEKLYLSDSLSMSEIASRLNVTIHVVNYWMKIHSIPKRNWSDATYVKRNPSGDPFEIKLSLNADEKVLYGLGLGLYWGERNKASKVAVRLTNSDPRVIQTFIRFLREICRVDDRKIRFWLQIFGDIDKETALKYWQNQVGYSDDHFLPSVVVSPTQGKGTYKNKSLYGVLTVMVCNKKLRDWLVNEIDSYLPT